MATEKRISIVAMKPISFLESSWYFWELIYDECPIAVLEPNLSGWSHHHPPDSWTQGVYHLGILYTIMYILYVCTLHNSMHIVHSTFSFSRTWPQDALALTGLATGAKNIRVVPEKEIVRLEMTVPHGAMVT